MALASSMLNTVAFWRYVDATAPRVLSLVMHSLIVWRFGAADYAIAAWTLGVFGLLLAVLPDPHSLILVRAQARRAVRLLSLTVPALAVKLILAAAASIALTVAIAAPSLDAGVGAAALVAVSVCAYASAEAVWSVLGTVALAIGNVRHVAVAGLGARFVALCGVAIACLIDEAPLWLAFAMPAVPISLAAVYLLPRAGRWRRSRRFFVVGAVRYAIWNQGLSLLTGLLAQAPVLILGAYPLLAAREVGQISFVLRIVMLAIQPVQVLQSLVIREVASKEQARPEVLTRMKLIFRLAAVAIASACACVALLAHAAEAVSPNVIVISAAVAAGVAFSTWRRFELARALATQRIRRMCVQGWAVFLGAALTMLVAVPIWGVPGLAVVMMLTWIAVSLTWNDRATSRPDSPRPPSAIGAAIAEKPPLGRN